MIFSRINVDQAATEIGLISFSYMSNRLISSSLMAFSCATKAGVSKSTENVKDIAQLWVSADSAGCSKPEDQ